MKESRNRPKREKARKWLAENLWIVILLAIGMVAFGGLIVEENGPPSRYTPPDIP